MQTIQPDDSRLQWQGAISVEHTANWSKPWRIPYAQHSLFPPDDLQSRAAMPAGVRMTFRSDTRTLAGKTIAVPEQAPLDLCCDGELVGSVELAGRGEFVFSGLPPGEKLIELWLPQFGEFRLRSLAIDAGAALHMACDVRRRWVTYGSSITQCRTAASPTATWPAIVARRSDLQLTCLGYGGQCHLDLMIARMVRDLPADYLSICVGINIYGAASFSPRSFRPALIGFVQTVRERHPVAPFVVLSPIFSPPREKSPNAVGFTLQAMRAEVAEAVAALQAAGDRHLHYVDGLEIFGPAYAHLLPDDLHPDAAGYQVMGHNFAEKVAARLFQ